jgi:predicted RNA-binding protein associated with RNAse of E/G family
VDLVLDLVVAPDHSCRLKDEDDFERAVADGHLTAEVANRVRAEAERMIAVLAAGGPPFCESGWLGWRPPADWTVPPLPRDWAR